MKKALILLLAIMHEGKLYYCCEPTSKTGRAGERKWKKYVVTRLDKIR